MAYMQRKPLSGAQQTTSIPTLQSNYQAGPSATTQTQQPGLQAPGSTSPTLTAGAGVSTPNPMQAQAPLSSNLPTFGGQANAQGTMGQRDPGPGAGAPPGAPAEPGEFNMDKMYQDIMGQHEGSWGDKEKMIQQQGLMNQRRAANINASMGRSVGGGFAGMLGAAMMGTQNQLLGAKTQHDEQGRRLQLGFLDRKIQEKQRAEDLEERTKTNELLYGGGDTMDDLWKYGTDKDRRAAFQKQMEAQGIFYQDPEASEAAYNKWVEENKPDGF